MLSISPDDAIFPYYAEVCVLTQYHKKGATPSGCGMHASLFLHGAEIDPAWATSVSGWSRTP